MAKSKTPETTEAEVTPDPKLDKSFPASLRRIADAIVTAPVWDGLTAAKALLDEANLLDPPKA